MDSEKKSRISDGGAWAMNVVSSVSIIMVNKLVMSSSGYGFGFATTLTAFHFTVTALVGWISNASRSSASKHVPLWELFWFSVVANVSITGMNFSLMLNSVGFYQISKLSMIPVVCVMEWILHNKNYSGRVLMAVFVVALGVGVCTVTDVDINMKGFLCACVAVFCTSLQQIERIEVDLVPHAKYSKSIGSLQKKYSIGSFELLSKTAPIQAASLLLLGPITDYYLNRQFILNYTVSYGAVFFILLSCSLAVVCNMSQYLCIGRFSAVSFQVLGHMKTVCVLVLGWVLFDSALTFKNILGMVLAVVGMVIYSWAVEADRSTNVKTTQLVHTGKDGKLEENVRLLRDKGDIAFSDIERGQTKN
ncbi:UDP-rhamnose/UDP-galactose transporter 1 [Asimina triloba]